MAVSPVQTLQLDTESLNFEQIDDLKTLAKTVGTYPGLHECRLERQFTELVPNLLKHAWSEETLF